MIFILATLFAISIAQTCNSNRVTTCTGVSLSACPNSYQFVWNADAQWTTQPRNCKVSGPNCVSDISYLCEPPCTLYNKVGGPGGLFCRDFTTKANCIKYYADDSGDRWCYWDVSGTCKGYDRTCHN